jgi:uncharacterized protein YpmB
LKKWILIGIGTIILIVVIFTNIYLNAINPIKKAEKKAVEAAREKVDISSVQDLQIYNGNETYYILKAKNKKNTDIIAWVPEKGGNVIVRKASDGITQQEAVDRLFQEKDPKEIVSVRLAILKNRECWEIYYLSHNNLINYYYIDFKTGEWLRKIENM